jgi:hypothetical protein
MQGLNLLNFAGSLELLSLFALHNTLNTFLCWQFSYITVHTFIHSSQIFKGAAEDTLIRRRFINIIAALRTI